MKVFIKNFFLLLFFLNNICFLTYGEQPWEELKGKHFVILSHPQVDVSIASKALQKAENYYTKIADQIGYSRYSQFWTWDERVKIIIFPDQQTFVETTGQPPWSKGYSARDSHVYQSKTIITFVQEEDFFEGLLPHEISHLILSDFLKGRSIPTWFNEGVAQLYEVNRVQMADHHMGAVIRKNMYIPFGELMSKEITGEEDNQKVIVFYLQSVSIIDFLIKKYGRYAFERLCHNLKDGQNFEEALKGAYRNTIYSLEDLQQKWIKYYSQ